MKSSFLKPCSYVVFIIVLTIGCKKELSPYNLTGDAQSLTTGRSKNECRLTNLSALGGAYDFRYNSAGLAERWEITDYGLFRQEYDANGRLTISRLYDGDELIYTVHFVYENNRVVQEIWYNGNTTVIDDDIYYTYNNKGLIERGESFIKDYYTINMFTPQGNTASFVYYVGGLPVFGASLSYEDKVKNPYLAVPGIQYAFPFANPTYFTNKWWATSERVVFYDENGEEIVEFDYDPSKTTWDIGRQNYPLLTTYHDRISGTSVPYRFEYENCAPGNASVQPRTRASGITSARKGMNPLGLIKRGSSKSITEQVADLRRSLQSKNP